MTSKTKNEAATTPTITTVSLSPEIAGYIARWADRRGLSRSSAITEIIGRYREATMSGESFSADARAKVSAFVRSRRWGFQDLRVFGALARISLGAKLGDRLARMSVGELLAIVDEFER